MISLYFGIICLGICFLFLLFKKDKRNILIIDFLCFVFDKHHCSHIIHLSNRCLVLCFDFYFLVVVLLLKIHRCFISQNVVPELCNIRLSRCLFIRRDLFFFNFEVVNILLYLLPQIPNCAIHLSLVVCEKNVLQLFSIFIINDA